MSIPQEINCNELSKKLWGGTLCNLNHDLLKHSVELTINVIDSGVKFNYLLICLNINEFKITFEHPEEDWDYVELTEIDIKRNNDIYTLKCDLWSSGCMLIKCNLINLIEK